MSDRDGTSGENSARAASAATAPARVAIGSERHKQLLCALLLDTFDPYRPAVIAWPALAPEAQARLVGLPFWDVAIETEENAGARMQALADATSDPLIRQALALNAFEERRHKDVLGHMMRFYGITVSSDIRGQPLRDPRRAFLRTGGAALGIDLDPRRFLALCIAENERRLAPYDARLLRPRLMPAAARLATRLLGRTKR